MLLLSPRRSMRRSTGEPATRCDWPWPALPLAGRHQASGYGHLTPAGQRLKRSRPAVGAAQAVGRAMSAGLHPLRHKHWVFHPGTYKVPEDMPETFAKWAQKEGAIIERHGESRRRLD